MARESPASPTPRLRWRPVLPDASVMLSALVQERCGQWRTGRSGISAVVSQAGRRTGLDLDLSARDEAPLLPGSGPRSRAPRPLASSPPRSHRTLPRSPPRPPSRVRPAQLRPSSLRLLASPLPSGAPSLLPLASSHSSPGQSRAAAPLVPSPPLPSGAPSLASSPFLPGQARAAAPHIPAPHFHGLRPWYAAAAASAAAAAAEDPAAGGVTTD